MLKWARIGWTSVLGAALLTVGMGGVASGASGELSEIQKRAGGEASLYLNRASAEKAMYAEWTLIPQTVSIGDVVMVRSANPGEVSWQGKTYKLQSFGVGYYTYLPVPRQVKPGNYQIGGKPLTVLDKKFKTQYLTVSKQMESMRQNTKRIAEDQKKIDAARSKSKAEFLFTSSFIQPVQGRLSTPYGHTRYVNGKFDKSHMAIDLAAKAGTPVKATNDGIVVLADSLYLTGNSIYIDHGMELFSQYVHLSKMYVKPGKRVKRGDVIGAVGSTGFSTGPHLHFAFWAHNVQVNPNMFFGTTPFKWLKVSG
ncbi:M23 family metallopeptidase [Cohnella kolymensis]|uniref:M23 family metallopeptidase n=1 Tax=Cohnella kolymensis TaxID=1590652 RepID=UPI0006971233|nr:M23 family metallopeptidase [Cohnella kolymensis]